MIAPVAVNVKLQEKKKSRCKRVLAGACSKAKQRETMLGCEGTANLLKSQARSRNQYEAKKLPKCAWKTFTHQRAY